MALPCLHFLNQRWSLRILSVPFPVWLLFQHFRLCGVSVKQETFSNVVLFACLFSSDTCSSFLWQLLCSCLSEFGFVELLWVGVQQHVWVLVVSISSIASSMFRCEVCVPGHRILFLHCAFVYFTPRSFF